MVLLSSMQKSSWLMPLWCF